MKEKRMRREVERVVRDKPQQATTSSAAQQHSKRNTAEG